MNNEDKLQKQSDKKNPSRRKYIIVIGIFLLLIIVALVFSLVQLGPQSDIASAKIIRHAAANQLNKDPNELTDADFTRITKLVLTGQEIVDINLLDKYKNLQHLELNFIRYPESNIAQWIKILGKLGIIDINKKYATDLKPLSHLSNLRELYLVGNAINNIEPLAEKKFLK